MISSLGWLWRLANQRCQFPWFINVSCDHNFAKREDVGTAIASFLGYNELEASPNLLEQLFTQYVSDQYFSSPPVVWKKDQRKKGKV